MTLIYKSKDSQKTVKRQSKESDKSESDSKRWKVTNQKVTKSKIYPVSQEVRKKNVAAGEKQASQQDSRAETSQQQSSMTPEPAEAAAEKEKK